MISPNKLNHVSISIIVISLLAIVAADSSADARGGQGNPGQGNPGNPGGGNKNDNNNNNKTCVNDDLCLKCVGKTGRCQICKPGYALKLSPSTKYNCTAINPTSKCDQFCTSVCSKSGDGKCDSECQPGYVLVNNNCRSCDANCDLSSGCSSAGPGLCDSQCNDGYVLVEHRCKACGSYCTSGCEVHGAYRCDSSCGSGYVLDNKTHLCFPCDSNCDPKGGCLKNGPFSCDTNCSSGYVLHAYSGESPSCMSCHDQCSGGCDKHGPGSCDSKCNPGYTLNTTTFLCIQCASNCDPKVGCDVNGAFKCDKCASGYVLDKVLQVCYPCDPHCAGGCDNSGVGYCDGPCKRGFKLRNSQCY